jgi:predicted amidohydrolase YtcJ
MTEPYIDNPSANGSLLQSESVFEDLIGKFFKNGWQVV